MKTTTGPKTDLPRSHDPDAAIVLPADLSETVAIALAEDIGSGDLTAALVPAGRSGRATVITREAASSPAGRTSRKCSARSTLP